MRGRRIPDPHEEMRPDRPVALAWGIYLSAFFFLAILGLLCAFYIQSARAAAVREWDGRLTAMADDREAAIEAWLEERWGDAQVIADFSTVRALLEGQASDREGEKIHMAGILTSMTASYGYMGAYVLDRHGAPLAVAADSPPLAPDCVKAALGMAPESPGKAILFYRGVRTGRMRLGFLVSVPTGAAAPASPAKGTVLLVMDPARWLFPLLLREPSPTVTGETLIAKVEDEYILFVSPLRFKVEEPLAFRLPLSTPTIAARYALQGESTFGEFTDYRGVPIFAATRPIRGTDWGLVAKVDQKEALAGFREKRAFAVAEATALLLAFLGLAYSLWRRQRTQYLREMLRRDARYRLLSERTRDIILFVRQDGAIMEASKAAESVYGYSREELLRLSIRDLRAPDHRNNLQADLEKASAEGGALFETLHQRRDGTAFPVEVSSVAAEIAGEPVLLSVIRDITERKRAEEATRITEERYKAVVENIADGYYEVDVKGDFTFFSDGYARMLGYPREEMMGLNNRAYMSPDTSRRIFQDFNRVFRTGEPLRAAVYRFLRKSGEPIDVEVSAALIRGPEGDARGFQGVVSDITERLKTQAVIRRTEERLAQAKNLETIGLIAGGVAHEVRNPLFAITTIVTALEKKLSDQPEYGEYVSHIQDQANRLNELMNDLLTLGRPVDEARFKLCTLREILESTLGAMEVTQPAWKARFKVEWAKAHLGLSGDQGRLIQVVQNILSNAIAFSPESSPVRIRAWSTEDMGCLSVTDEGPGIPAEMLPKLFQPFASRRKGGTGLGLAIVQKIVEAHGGTVEAANNDPPPGATFTVRLPLASKESIKE